jgi:Mycothiol maleylpyruvate isomerase N-terminal domain
LEVGLTKTELLAALRTNGDDAVAALRALPEGAFDAGRYENGWNAKQILAHIASIEWTYPRLLDLGAQAAPAVGAEAPQASAPASTPVRRTSQEEAAGLPTRPAAGGIDSYNDRQVQKRADAPVEDLIAEFEKNRAATIAAVESADDDLFARLVRSAGGITGVLADVIRAVAVDHVAMHVADITGAKHEGARW